MKAFLQWRRNRKVSKAQKELQEWRGPGGVVEDPIIPVDVFLNLPQFSRRALRSYTGE